MMTGREAKRNNERLEYKFFSEYFKSQHKDLYDEACSFYDKVKEKNPNVRDLTKTVEFVARTKPNEMIPKYYYRRQARTTPTTAKQTELTMVLNIPLTTSTNPSSQAPIETTATNPPSQAPIETTATNPPSQALIETTATNPPSQAPIETAATNPSSQAPIETTATNPSSQALIETTATNPPSQAPIEEPLMLADDTFHHLMSEIQQDPDLWAIFNNFEIPNMNDNYDDDGMNPQVWNDLDTLHDISLSEMEIP